MKIFDVKRRKKASLELSINSIVILILAITMLGLGLTFMRGLFKNISTKVSESVSANELVNPPTFDNPMTIAPGEITLRQNEDSRVTLAFQNIITSAQTSTCLIPSSGGVVIKPATTTTYYAPQASYSSASLLMQKDQINTWVIAIATKYGTITASTGVSLITVKIQCTPTGGTARDFTKDFIVTVTS